MHSSSVVLHISLHRVLYGRKWLLSRVVNLNYYIKKIPMQNMLFSLSGLNLYGHSPINLMLYFFQLHLFLYRCSVLICHHALRCVIALTWYNIRHLYVGCFISLITCVIDLKLRKLHYSFYMFCVYLNFPFWRWTVSVNAIAYQKIYCKVCTLMYCWLELKLRFHWIDFSIYLRKVGIR